MADQGHKCPRCSGEEKTRIRSFSDQATAALVVWGELNKKLVGQPICNSCYEELRDVLIDRADELARGELLAPEPITVSAPVVAGKKVKTAVAPVVAAKKEKAPAASPAKKKAPSKKAG